MKFSHPLARGAKFGRVETLDNGADDVLVVVTTLNLDPNHKKHKPDKIQRLRDAAREFLKEKAPGVNKMLLLNPET
jgi:hypothetical protein